MLADTGMRHLKSNWRLEQKTGDIKNFPGPLLALVLYGR